MIKRKRVPIFVAVGAIILIIILVGWFVVGPSIILSEKRYYAIQHELYPALKEHLEGNAVGRFEVFENKAAILIIHNNNIRGKGRPIIYYNKDTKRWKGFVLSGY